MKKTTYILTLVTAFVMLIQSCTKDTNNNNSTPTNTYYYLTAAQLNQTPYFNNPAFDTISFTSDKGDTLSFVKTKTDTTWYCERASINPENSDKHCYQILHNMYTTVKGKYTFDVKHWRQSAGYDVNFIDISIDNKTFHIYESSINDTKASNYLNTITIFNKTFHDTHDFINNNLKVYINKESGIFSIEDRSDTTQFLITK